MAKHSYKIDSSCHLHSTDKFSLHFHYSNERVPSFQKGRNFLWPIYCRMISLFALLLLIDYGSTRCTVCSQHNSKIENKLLKKVNIVHMKHVNIVIAEVKI